MEHAIRCLNESFPGHEVAFKSRPDGKLLVSLSQNGKSLYMKAIDPCTLMHERDLRSLINEFNLSRKSANGTIRKEDIYEQLLQSALPTFSGSPINPTAAKMIWIKREGRPTTHR